MARKHEFIKLKEDERSMLIEHTSKGRHSARKLRRVKILLLNHEGHKAKDIGGLVGCSTPTVYNILSRYKAEGIEVALNEKKRTGRPPVYAGVERAKITALACSEAPPGYEKWTLRLLADRAVELKCVNQEKISHTSILRILKKTI